MGAESGSEGPPVALAAVVDRLLEEAPGFEFHQAVRLLERGWPDRVPVGGWGDPDEEVVRFSAHPSLAFPPGDIHELRLDPEADAAEGPPWMSVNFMGLVGPNAVLPHPYTLMVAEAVRSGDTTMRDFLDLVQHRMISLFYASWRKHRVTVARESGGEEEDPVARHILDLMGVGMEGLREATRARPWDLVPLAGLVAPEPRSALALERLLTAFFDVPAEVEQFVGGWARLEDHDLCELGEETPSTRLGLGAVVGDEIWDPQSRVRVRLGPLARERFDRFLPRGEDHDVLREICRFFGHDQYDVEVRLVLERDDVPPCILDPDRPGHALGWSTWIRTRPLDRDPDETILTL
jgi:type VI secretion system protein ImpH